MAEASIAAFAATAGVFIALGFVCFALKRVGHPKKTHSQNYDKVTIDNLHVHADKK